MNTLTALTLTACFAASLHSAAAGADELTEQIRTEVQLTQTELRADTVLQARRALHKTAIELLAQHTAQQDAQTALLAYQAQHSAPVEAE
ncbi:hypothetical protein HRH59_00645 [Rheinheimera sp. YQF-2]|uniref:Uncharacterized protein n=1 Tax=Rheinheimera lutimaris TaxID=2740584 RepID=A0A7Y5EJH1_9GAMM|nr:hypothetical protein [Rheinheimera lutimaris]NRQ41083.1 hypothetical protein [Rheinheimera lutimaris]